VLVTSLSRETPDPARAAARHGLMSAISAVAETAYRSLVQGRALVSYFYSATPIDEIAFLNLGSRPARRRPGAGTSDLRAIPWVFAWTQSRVNLPAWYGLGTALASWAGEGDEGWDELRTAYREWPFLRTLVDNAQLSLRKADLLIAEVYSSLASAEDRADVFLRLQTEYDLTERSIERITGQTDLLDNEPWLKRAIRLRNPYIDPMNYAQVALLRRLRASPEGPEAAELRDAVLLSVNGIAAGLRNTG
jgi:phosphoenolpyruvate carboxylase